MAPSFRQVFQASGYSSKWIVCRAYAGVRGTYAGPQAYGERTQSVCRTYAAHGIDSHDFFDGLFLAVFSEVLAVSSRISSFPQILGLSESRRQSPGWHSLDGSLPIWAVRGLGSQFLRAVSSSIGSEVRSELPGPSLRVRLVRNNLFRRPAGAALRAELSDLRFEHFYLHRGPGVDASGHTRSLQGQPGQGVLFLTECQTQGVAGGWSFFF